jgi:enamine deaminase RidA (YjgF/YER057c/UK114 family)
MSAVEERLASHGITVPDVTPPLASYVPVVRAGNLVFVSGQVPLRDGQPLCVGTVGAGVTEDEAKAAARQAGVQCVAAAKSVLGDLDQIVRVVRVGGYVNCAPDFTRQPAVVDGASDLFIEAFGEAGRHARSSIGCNGLPLGSAVEVDVIFEVRD